MADAEVPQRMSRGTTVDKSTGEKEKGYY